MATTPEGRVKKQIKKVLDEYKCYYFMPVQNGMGAASLDFHCIVPPHGTALCIEAKAPGKRATPRQEVTMERMQEAGGYTVVIDGSDMSVLEDLLVKILMIERAGEL